MVAGEVKSWTSHQRWEILGRIFQRKVSRVKEKKRIRDNGKNGIKRIPSSLVCLCLRIQTQIYIFHWLNQTNGQISFTTWWSATVKTYTNHYQGTCLPCPYHVVTEVYIFLSCRSQNSQGKPWKPGNRGIFKKKSEKTLENSRKIERETGKREKIWRTLFFIYIQTIFLLL